MNWNLCSVYMATLICVLIGLYYPDCCDGSDEYDGQVKCPNTCWEAGKVARERLIKKIRTYKEGVTMRNQEIEKAKISLAKDEAELTKLKNEEKILKGLVQQLKGKLFSTICCIFEHLFTL